MHVLARLEVEDVVDDLEGHADVVAGPPEASAAARAGALASGGPGVEGEREEGGGLAGDRAEVGADARRVARTWSRSCAISAEQIAAMSRARARAFSGSALSAERRKQREKSQSPARIGLLDAEARVEGGLAAPERRLVDDVVVDEGGDVEELDGGGERSIRAVGGLRPKPEPMRRRAGLSILPLDVERAPRPPPRGGSRAVRPSRR